MRKHSGRFDEGSERIESDASASAGSPGQVQSDILVSCGPALRPDPARTVLRPFHIAGESDERKPDGRTADIIARILALSPAERHAEASQLAEEFTRRHGRTAETFDRRYAQLHERLAGPPLDSDQARLIGAFFTEEFSVEAAALFNPSVVPHPDQSGLDDGDTRLIMSLRGIGEGHISSLLFQTGVWRANGSVTFDERGPRAVGPEAKLPDAEKNEREALLEFHDGPVGERVIYPFLPSQGRGIEDARLCHFTEDDGSKFYRGTFTAFDGMQVRQAVLQTEDFRRFTARRLDGDLAFLKGAAWFPRRIGGRYAMLGRLDEESISLLLSDDPDTWNGGETIIRPTFPWELVQTGNCGSPIEIDEGWLVLTHGVGKARTYCMGAALLDRDDPAKLLARTAQPILTPAPADRGGYVPNVVYSCGGMVRGRQLLLPYGVADNYSSIGTIDLDELIRRMN